MLQGVDCPMNKPSKSKAEQQAIAETLRALQFALAPLQLCDIPPESDRQILRCAPPFDAQAEHEKDLEYESRVDYESLAI